MRIAPPVSAMEDLAARQAEQRPRRPGQAPCQMCCRSKSDGEGGVDKRPGALYSSVEYYLLDGAPDGFPDIHQAR
jgi:hypothetical protein